MEVETGGACKLINLNRHYREPFGWLDTGSTPLPRYGLGDQAEIPCLPNAFERDFLSAFGEDPTEAPGSLTINEQDRQPRPLIL